MIATCTLNPAIDRNMEVESLVLDDTNRVVSMSRQAGGKGINVSRVVRELGGETVAYGFVGGYDGDMLKKILRRERVPFDFTAIRRDVRSNFIVTDMSTHRQTRLSTPGPQVSDVELKRLVNRITGIKPKPSYMVFAGSVPPGVPMNIYHELIHIMRKEGVLTVLDSSDQWLKAGVTARPYIIKPNVREAEVLMGEGLKTEKDIIRAVGTLVARGVGIACISRGRDGMIVADKDIVLKVVPPDVHVMSTVGAGDSTVAGLVLKLSEGGSLEEAVRLAVAAGTAATLTSPSELCHADEVAYLLPQVKVERVGG